MRALRTGSERWRRNREKEELQENPKRKQRQNRAKQNNSLKQNTQKEIGSRGRGTREKEDSHHGSNRFGKDWVRTTGKNLWWMSRGGFETSHHTQSTRAERLRLSLVYCLQGRLWSMSFHCWIMSGDWTCVFMWSWGKRFHWPRMSGWSLSYIPAVNSMLELSDWCHCTPKAMCRNKTPPFFSHWPHLPLLAHDSLKQFLQPGFGRTLTLMKALVKIRQAHLLNKHIELNNKTLFRHSRNINSSSKMEWDGAKILIGEVLKKVILPKIKDVSSFTHVVFPIYVLCETQNNNCICHYWFFSAANLKSNMPQVRWHYIARNAKSHTDSRKWLKTWCKYAILLVHKITFKAVCHTKLLYGFKRLGVLQSCTDHEQCSNNL